MRPLPGNLETNQMAMLRPNLLKLVLVKSGEATQTYDISSTTNRILRSSHIEQEWSQLASISVHSDTTLAALSLEGYLGTISYGYNDATNGDEFSAAAPLEVIGHDTPTLLSGRQSQLITTFSLAGVFNMMAADTASEKHTQTKDNTDTVKTLLTAIVEATMACFDHCKAYTITFDGTEESLLDSYIPADYFYIAFNETRLSAISKLMATVKSVARIEDDGEIHIFNPTVSGTSYDYEYNDAVSNHNFFEKGVRQRLVIPTKWIITSHPDHPSDEQFSGSATDSASETALGRSLPRHRYVRATSDQQCADIAAALLQHSQVGAERGRGLAPMNCGQEVMDWIKITDSVAGDTRTGNMGYLRRDYIPGREFELDFRFGRIAQGLEFAGLGDPEGVPTYDDLNALKDYIDEGNLALAQWVLNQQEVIPKLHVPIRFRQPVR